MGSGKWEVGSGIKVAILNRSPRLSQSQGKLGWVRYLLPFVTYLRHMSPPTRMRSIRARSPR